MIARLQARCMPAYLFRAGPPCCDCRAA